MVDLTKGQKISYGRQAISSYQNQMVKSFGSKWQYTMQGLIDILCQNDPIFIEKLGEQVYQGNLGQRRLNEAMERVADKTSPSKLPTFWTFSMGISDELTDFDFSLFGDAALDVGKSIIEAGKKGGEVVANTVGGVVDSISFVGKYLKWIIIGVVGLVILIYFRNESSIMKKVLK